MLERGRDVVAVEVKATATPTPAHSRHLAFLRDRVGERFKCGIVMHTGDQRLRLGDRLVAVAGVGLVVVMTRAVTHLERQL